MPPHLSLDEKLKVLPDRPGVYLFKNARGEYIYIGKAASLRSRVRSYFRGVPDHPRTARLLDKLADFEILSTDSEIEALILEANLIKEHKPRYNVALKDDKRYPYIKVTTNEPYPRMLVVRRMRKDGARYFGPYTQVRSMRETIKTLGRVFQIRTCNLVIPSPTGRRYRVCLDYYIKRCPGPCEDLIAQAEYRRLIDAACLFLEGKSEQLLRELSQRMEEASERMHFEEAAAWRDKLRAVESVRQKQKVTDGPNVDRDVIGIARADQIVAAVVLQVRDGALIGRQSFQLRAETDDADAVVLTEFIKQYYLNSPAIPDAVDLPFDCAEPGLIAEWLTREHGRTVTLMLPKRGERAALLEMTQTNARLSLNEFLSQREKTAVRIPDAVYQLQRDLRLATPPRNIAAFDVSNLGATDPVGSMVYFRDAKPLKRNYRKFKIRSVIGQNDFAMMGEIVARYFEQVVESGQEFPDLVLIDGGAGQLKSALMALDALNIADVPAIGLAKRLEQVILPESMDADGRTLTIPRASPSLRLLQHARDEAHRFALTFQKNRRKKRVLRSELDAIPGVGPARRGQLLSRLGSVEAVRAATEPDLIARGGLDRRTARAVWGFFHQDSAATAVPAAPETD